jgi:hypothetical protein
MSPLFLILILGVSSLAIGVATGWLVGRRVLPDVPDWAFVTGGLPTAFLGYFGLVSYLGFLFYPPGLFAVGFGIGRTIRRMAPTRRP